MTEPVDTKAALDDAISAHFGTRWGGAIVTGYVLQVAGLTPDDVNDGDQTSYLREIAERQQAHVTLGLIEFMRTNFTEALNQYDGD